MADRGDIEGSGDGQHDGEDQGEGQGRGGGRGEYRRFRPRYVRRGGPRNFGKDGEDGGPIHDQEQVLHILFIYLSISH